MYYYFSFSSIYQYYSFFKSLIKIFSSLFKIFILYLCHIFIALQFFLGVFGEEVEEFFYRWIWSHLFMFNRWYLWCDYYYFFLDYLIFSVSIVKAYTLNRHCLKQIYIENIMNFILIAVKICSWCQKVGEIFLILLLNWAENKILNHLFFLFLMWVSQFPSYVPSSLTCKIYRKKYFWEFLNSLWA